ncbi:reprolysin family zinc metalloprotease [Necator americanus]|uniref:Reprolysin family zinc metalloprotease n=1 Tax=Necator americanus TaxID=51031 RepID=W2SHB4_NECAM|nr:reprolysin family zinc metalloprotease [Necator americanus]ETN69039.1 reprolysin family zinc metalloprotease [Necator americanus]
MYVTVWELQKEVNVQARHYGHQRERIRAAMLTLMHAVNLYAFQLDIRIAIVDVLPIRGHNISLEQFLDWRTTTEDLVTHDVAILIRHRYEGGIAYVNGVCKRTAVGIAGFFPEAPYEYASVFFHELSHLLGLSHTSTADCKCSKKNRGNCLRIDGFDRECSAQALVDLLPSIECLGEPRRLPRTVLPLCGNGIVEDDEDCDCGPAKQVLFFLSKVLNLYCNNALCEPRTCRFIVAREYLYTTFTFGVALAICGILMLIKRTFSRDPDSTLAKKKKTKLPPLHARMLFSPDSPASEVPTNLQTTNTFLSTRKLSSPNPVKLPTIMCTPVRPAPKPPVQLTLDSVIPVTKEPIVTSEYVPMNPPKSMRIVQREPSLRLPSITAHRPKISDPIPLIVAGRVVNEQASPETPISLPRKPSQEFIASLEDALRAQTSERRVKLSLEHKNTTLPKPPLPDRADKPALRPFLDPPKERVYDLPTVDS